MKKITSDAHCIKISRLDFDNQIAVVRFSWISLTNYTMKIVGYSVTGQLILEPLKYPMGEVQYYVSPEDGQFKINEWLLADTVTVNA